jgi:signal transduction histidine kinase
LLLLCMWLPVLALGSSVAVALGVTTSRIADLRADQSAHLALALEEQRLRGFVAGRLALLNAWVRTAEIQSNDLTRIRTFLAGEERAFARLFEHLYFDALDGMVYPTRGEPFSVADRPYFAAIARGEELVSDPFISRDTGKRVVLVSVPVRSPTGEHLGALAGTVETEALFGRLGPPTGAEVSGLTLAVVDPALGTLYGPASPWAERLLAAAPALAAGVSGVDLPGQGPSVRVWSVPLRQAGWLLVATRPEAAIYATSRSYQLIILGLLLLTLAGTFFGARALARRWARSLGELTTAFQRFGAGDSQVRVTPAGDDEVGSLGRAFNDMADRLEASEAARRKLEHQLAQSARLESIGRLAGGVAHDYNNLLTVIINLAQLAAAELGEEHPVAADVQGILDAANRSAALTQQLLAIARRKAAQPEELPIDQGLAGTKPLLERLLPSGVELRWLPAAAGARVRIDPTHLLQVVMNLVINARDALGGTGTITVSTQATLSHAELRVADSGPGVPPEIRDHLFEPFVSTKGEGKGTGLGLATCYGLVTQAGGQIALESAGPGACFVVSLPRVDAPQAKA